MGMLTGRYRKGQEQPDSGRVRRFPTQMSDERRLDAVERLIPVAEEAEMSLTHMAMAFVLAHPGVTSALIGPRKAEHLDDLLAGTNVGLSDETLDRIDEICPPGTDVGRLEAAYDPPAVLDAHRRRRSPVERAAG